MSQTEALKFSLKQSIVNASYGENVDLSVDLSHVKDLIVDAAGALGAGKCLMLGGGAAIAATATYVLVKSIAQKWPWAKVTNVEQDTIEVTVPKDKEDRFAKLLEQNKIQEKLADDFENMEDNLEGILPGEYEDHGADIIKLLKGIKLASIASKESAVHKGMKAQTIFEGKVDQTIHGQNKLFTVGKDVSDTVAQEYVGEGADVKQTIYGGNSVMTVGVEGEDLKTVADTFKDVAGDNIQVRIDAKVGNTLKKFERKFKATTTVKEVRRELNDEVKKYLRIFRDEKELDENMTLAQAAQTGSTVNWEAKE